MNIRIESALPHIFWAARPFPAWLAWSLLAVSLSLLALTATLVLLGRSEPLPDGFYPQWEGLLVSVPGAVGAPVLGLLITNRRPGNRYGWLWCGFGLSFALLLFTQSYIAYSVATSHTLPALGLILALGSTSWLLLFAFISFLMLLFPDGILPSPRWRFVAWIALGAALFGSVAGVVVPGESGIASTENPYGVRGVLGQVITMLVHACVFTLFAAILLAVLSLIFRYRTVILEQR